MKRDFSISGACFKLHKNIVGECGGMDDLPQECRLSWYWNRKEIENSSPSRKDGIDLRTESQLRMLYCSFLQDIGMKLAVPQVTIATAMMLCHRFYLHQSHAKNEWQMGILKKLTKLLIALDSDEICTQILKCYTQRFLSPGNFTNLMVPLLVIQYPTIATVCMFLASKIEDTPCHLNKVVTMAYEMMYQKDPVAAQRIHKKDVFEKQKALILIGERLVLCTIRFDFNIQHPYKPLCEAFRALQISQCDVRQTAWNFVNDWLRTTLCLQYKPNYIAAASLYLAAKHHNVKLPSGSGPVWWQVLNIMPQQLDAIVRQMMELLGYKKKPLVTPQPEKPKQAQSPIAAVAKEEASSSPDSCVLSRDGSCPKNDVDDEASNTASRADPNDQCSNKIRDAESPDGVVEVCGEINKGVQHALNKINVSRIKALMKIRKRSRETNKSVKVIDGSSEEAWIERELEDGVEAEAGILVKRQK